MIWLCCYLLKVYFCLLGLGIQFGHLGLRASKEAHLGKSHTCWQCLSIKVCRYGFLFLSFLPFPSFSSRCGNGRVFVLSLTGILICLDVSVHAVLPS